ncbi:uncharacterized protein LOC128013739 [Carassius gibelio]|uniref:uncharacterized protein LOC128013739 n=1 Tax=Carassius gibelio TaxID=101364 RepID=UPI0022778F60|nr:uncharacterized protein LOC128013739 [Carassius gibelio]
MPRTPSHVWIHFTSTNLKGKAVYSCKYCAKTYVKNATKMQQHIAKCPKFPQSSKQATPDKSSSASSIRCGNDSDSGTLSSAPAHSGTGGLFDSMDERSQRHADECFARAMYATGSPLTLTSNVYWKRFLNVLRPAYTPSTSHALSTRLLDEEFNRVQAKVKQTIDKADCICVISDGWSNVRGQGVITYIVTTPQPVLYKSTDTKHNRRTGSYIADELKAVINDLGPEKVCALVTDDAANMKVAWAHVQETYPHITTIGCAAHALNRLLKDIMALSTMNTLYKTAKQVVKYVKGKQLASAVYLSKQREQNKNGRLRLPSIPRGWAGVVIMYHSLLEGKESLQEMAISQTAAIESAIKGILLDDMFWERVTGSLRILKPIAAAIAKIEGDAALLSDVKYLFAELKDEMQAVLPASMLLQAEETSVVKSLEKHLEFCMKPIHAAAYMLDPKYEKSILSVEEIRSAYSVITAMSRRLGLDEGKVLGSLAKYRTKQGLWEWDGIWQSCRHISASTWWKGLCGFEALAPVASIILQIPPTSAASERKWSRFGNAHTKVRNRLTNAREEKLVAVRANLRLFEPDTEPSWTRLDSDTEDEDESDMEDVDEVQEEEKILSFQF